VCVLGESNCFAVCARDVVTRMRARAPSSSRLATARARMPIVARARRAEACVPQRLLVADDVDGLREWLDARPEGDDELLARRAARSGKAPLHLAAWRGSLDVVKCVLERGGAIDQISTGRHNYGKTAVFYATTRCRDDVVLYLLQRGAKVKIVNNKGQSVRSLALSHCERATIEAIEEAERRETTWWNFRASHSDGLKYGDLDERFFPDEVANEPARGVSTRESRRGNFSRLNKGVSWDNPDGIDRSLERKAAAKQKREKDAETAWEEFGTLLRDQRLSKDVESDAMVELVAKILRAETAIAVSGEKPDVSSRAAETLAGVADDDGNLSILRALVGVRLRDCGISDRVRVREEKARRTACRILASAVASAMDNGAWSSVTSRQMFDICGSVSTFVTTMKDREMMFTEDQIVSAIVRACEEINCRELNDIAALLEITDAKTMTTTSRALESVTDFAQRMCSAIDASDPTSVAHTAVSLADLGGRVESWRQPIFAGLDEAIATLDSKTVSKVARRLVDTWENDITTIASNAIVECMEISVLDDLMDRGDWLEAKAYALTRETLRETFDLRAPDEFLDVDANLQSMTISSELPLLVPKKRIIVVEDECGLERIKEVLASPHCDAFAFDCEWRDPRPISTLQISPVHNCETFVIDCLRIERTRMSTFIADVFGESGMKKIAFAPEQDWKRLRVASKSYPSSSSSPLPGCFQDANVIDLQGDVMNSLASIVSETLGYALDKRCQRSNWDARPLAQAQITYAALDAEVLLDIASRLGIIAGVSHRSNLYPDAHLYASDSALFRDGTPRFGADLTATDSNLFAADARQFGANLWESDRLLYTTAEDVERDRRDTTLREIAKRAYVADKDVECTTCAICLNECRTNEKLIRTDCSHIFHASCLLCSLRNALRCPTCRASIDVLT